MNLLGNEIEKLVCEPMSKLRMNPMSKQMTEMFVHLEMTKNVDSMYSNLQDKFWQLKAIEKRIEVCLNISIDKKIQIFILLLNNANIGMCLLYMYFLQYKAKSMKIQNLTWVDFIRIFPNGYPSETDMFKIWDNQKNKTDKLIENAIDFKEASLTIM